ncbi:hypothetical protein ACIRO3_27280 [Streptomyces sp. NPDC102278]|uniref:hypothetical protein n=1 Tax=Streptomyces sp. NPDC102278 TaxID=3366152 RepID=UPI0038291D18
MVTGQGLPALAQYGDDATNRWLSAAAHLDAAYARDTDHELTKDRLTALGPSLGVDLVAVARHVRLAVRRSDHRDALLSVLLAAWAGAAVSLVYGLVRNMATLTDLALYALVAALGGAWILVLLFEHRARTLALRVVEADDPPDTLAPPLDKDLEAGLRAQERTNVVPYEEEAEFRHPFVGSGDAFQERVWQPIDIGTPAASPTGGTLSVIPFDVVDLHTYVAREMGKIAGLQGLRARNRLYVLGTRVRHAGEELLPDRLNPPRAVLPKQMVQAGLVRSGGGMRTYLCLERVGEGGRVIVSMHLRARLQHPSLTWEVGVYLIPPLHPRFEEVRTLRLDAFGHWWTLGTFSTRTFLPALFGAPSRLARHAYAWAAHRWRMGHLRRDIGRRHVEFDYGASTSVRQRAADWEQWRYSDRTDAQDFAQRLQQGVLTATEHFLKAHNVDTSSFDQAQQVINHHSYNFAGPIKGPSIFGAHGTVNVPAGGAGPGQPPAAPAQP